MTTTSTSGDLTVDFHFDVMCPWAYQSSLWMRAARDRVLLDPPTGEAAVRLWQAVVAWREFPQLFELQRPKSPDDQRAIMTTFKPYLEARDWVSINRGEVVGFPSTNTEV